MELRGSIPPRCSIFSMNKCLHCNNETSNAKFCTRSCATSFNNKVSPKRKIKRVCANCSNIVRNWRSTLCQEHFEQYQETRDPQNKTIGQYRAMVSVKGKHPSWLHSHIRVFARSWLKHLRELPCAKCGYELHVEMCHIKEISSFDDDVLLSEVNAEHNLIQLCPNCHWEFDNGYRNNFIELLYSLNKKF